jgi:hypothetical protein
MKRVQNREVYPILSNETQSNVTISIGIAFLPAMTMRRLQVPFKKNQEERP